MNMHEPGARRPRSSESPRPPPPLHRSETGPGARTPSHRAVPGGRTPPEGGLGRKGGGQGGLWRGSPPGTASRGGLVSRAPAAGDPHRRELPRHRAGVETRSLIPLLTYGSRRPAWPLRASSRSPGEESLGPPRGLSLSKPRLCRDEQHLTSCTQQPQPHRPCPVPSGSLPQLCSPHQPDPDSRDNGHLVPVPGVWRSTSNVRRCTRALQAESPRPCLLFY